MEKINCKGLIILKQEELNEVRGGFLPLLLTAAQVYITLCGLATLAGVATAYIESHLK